MIYIFKHINLVKLFLVHLFDLITISCCKIFQSIKLNIELLHFFIFIKLLKITEGIIEQVIIVQNDTSIV